LKSKRVVFVDTTSASAPFVEALSGPGRVIVTATRNGSEVYATLFGGPFVEAFALEAADADRDGKVSILEAFDYAKQAVAASYQREGLLPTEHALLDDNGDKDGSQDPAATGKDGRVANIVSLGTVGADNLPTDPKVRALYLERRELERRVESLRLLKESMEPARYSSELEKLVTAIALGSVTGPMIAAGGAAAVGIVVLLVVGAWLAAALEAEATRIVALDEDVAALRMGPRRSAGHPVAPRILVVRLIADVPLLIAVAWGSVRLVSVAYRELTSPFDVVTPIALRIRPRGRPACSRRSPLSNAHAANFTAGHRNGSGGAFATSGEFTGSDVYASSRPSTFPARIRAPSLVCESPWPENPRPACTLPGGSVR
jgi:hypothetical protein